MAVHPLLRKYNVRDPIVIAKHIDWITGQGINCSFFSWGIWYSVTKKIHGNILKILSHPLAKDMYFSILYETPERLNADNVHRDSYGFYYVNATDDLNTIKEDFKMIGELIEKPNFLRLNGKPAVYIYESKGIKGDIKHFIEAINEGSGESLFLISDHAVPIALPPSQEFLEAAEKYDSWSLWAAGYFRDREYSLDYLENGLNGWRRLAENYNKLFIPSVIPGFIDLRSSCIPYFRNPENFEKALRLALHYSFTPSSSKYKVIIRIDTFNEFGEATGIEPTEEEDFAYFKVLKKILENY